MTSFAQCNEKQSINQLLERETKRERNLDQLEKEAKMKARKEARKVQEEPEKNDEMEEKLKNLEVEFFEDDGAVVYPDARNRSASGASGHGGRDRWPRCGAPSVGR